MEEKHLTVPYIVFESSLDKAERRDKRNIILIIFLVALLVATNIVWIVAWHLYDYGEPDGGESADYLEDDGEINDDRSESYKDYTPEGGS